MSQLRLNWFFFTFLILNFSQISHMLLFTHYFLQFYKFFAKFFSQVLRLKTFISFLKYFCIYAFTYICCLLACRSPLIQKSWRALLTNYINIYFLFFIFFFFAFNRLIAFKLLLCCCFYFFLLLLLIFLLLQLYLYTSS